jgi:hypothetical protein
LWGLNGVVPGLMFAGVMADNFGLLSQKYHHLAPDKEHAGKDDVHPYRHALMQSVI